MVDYYFYRPLIGGGSLKLALSNELSCTFQNKMYQIGLMSNTRENTINKTCSLIY